MIDHIVQKILISSIIFLLLATIVVAQDDDATGCKDSRFFKRIPNTFITDCLTDSGEMEFFIYPDSIVRLEGLKTFIAYGYNEEKATLAPKFEQIVKHCEAEAIRRGGKKRYYSIDAGNATLFFKSKGKPVWVVIDDGSGDGEGYFSISILEPFEEVVK